MEPDLTRIQHRLAVLLPASFGLAPLAGYGLATYLEVVDAVNFLSRPSGLTVLALCLVLLAGIGAYARRLLRPMLAWHAMHAGTAHLPDKLNRRLARFGRNYWAFFLAYALLIPATHHLLEGPAAGQAGLWPLVLMQLVIAVLTGLPGYLYGLTLLGRVARATGLSRVQASMRSKLLLVGGYVPLLTSAILLKYYWWRTGYLQAETLLVWMMMGLVAFAITVLAIRSFSQALQPVQRVIAGSGASSYAGMAERLRPQSNDEIGYLVQTLGRLFRRMDERDAHVRAIVEAAAEGIIAVDQSGQIQTFNPAAERLFGYPSHEITGLPLSWLLPSLVGEGGAPKLVEGEQEVEGQHRSGRPIPMSVRVSRLVSDGRTLYTCLVADISERKAAERKLIEAEGRYRDLVETAHDLVWSMDAAGRWTYMNRACQQIYGATPEQMVGCHFSEFQATESAERDAAAFEQVLRGQELLHYETVHLDCKGNPRHLSFNAKPITGDDGRVLTVTGTARDITDQKAFEQELTYQARHDILTGLYNRHYFQQELERVVTRVARSGAESALIYLDLDQFKYINDTLGHAAGDRLLTECTRLLREHTRGGDLLARFGGDEFTLLIYNIDALRAQRAAENVRAMFEAYKFLEGGKTYNITCSIGLAMISGATRSADEALAQADLACNIAKNRGRNCVIVHDPNERTQDGMAEDMGWAVRVREACDNDGFQLVYQPIVAVADGKVHDYEVLLRMTVDNGEVILPGGFLPAAERFGLIHGVDRWTVRHAIEQLAELRRGGEEVRFAVNLSGRAFEDQELLGLIDRGLRDNRLDPGLLTFEITETAAISNLGTAVDFISKLKKLGCHFALDDFGSGFCSFTYLKHLPVDKLKIDGSFVQGLSQASEDQALVRSMNQIAHALGKQTIAEFVEDAATLDMLRELGVDFAQGYYIGRPRPELVSN